MGKLATRIPKFCLITIRPVTRVRQPCIQSRIQEKYLNEKKTQGVEGDSDKCRPSITGRKIMIVVDSTVEGKNAVQWALIHTVQNQDMVIFLHVTKPSKQGDHFTGKDLEVKVPQFITCMKNSWQIKKPEVHIEVMVVEGKEKGPAVVAAAKKRGVALLVVGQEEAVADADVGWELGGRWSGGVLCTKCLLYGNRSEAEEQQTWWISSYY